MSPKTEQKTRACLPASARPHPPPPPPALARRRAHAPEAPLAHRLEHAVAEAVHGAALPPRVSLRRAWACAKSLRRPRDPARPCRRA